MTELPIEGILLDCIAGIERQGVRYAVMGGFGAWGLPRPTFDADIAVGVDESGMRRLLGGLEADGFDVPAEHSTGFLDRVGGMEKAKVTRFAEGHVWSTDLFVATEGLLASALTRARRCEIARREVSVMFPEDVILLKLIAGRRKDLADVEDIVAMYRGLNLAYMREWAGRLGIQERLSEFFPTGG